MKYRIHEIRLRPGESKEAIPAKIIKKLGKQALGLEIDSWRILRESVDARKKPDIFLVYSVDFTVRSKDAPAGMPGKRLSLGGTCGLCEATDQLWRPPEMGRARLAHRPLIAGFGPSGMFAALILSELGYKPLVLERGREIRRRQQDVDAFWKEGFLDPESNVQFGEGGAGTFSDGKLTTGIKDVRIQKVLLELAAAGGGEDLLYKQNPHIGTDVLRQVVTNLRKKIESNGGEILFDTKLTGLEIDQEDVLTGVTVLRRQAAEPVFIPAEQLILAVGHSARDTFRALYALGLPMEQKPFSIGVRIEHPQRMINLAQYGAEEAPGLGAAAYKLSHRCANGRGVYTFCMCPGGEVILASSEAGGVVTNGMSRRARDGAYANSALLVDVRTSDFPSEHPLAGIEFQEKYERLAFINGGETYNAPKTTWGAFSTADQSALPLRNSLPEFAVEAMLEAVPRMGGKLRGFDSPQAVMTAVESRSSSPVRIPRSAALQSGIHGLYPAGEGAGYAGGIMSAAVDGMRVAEEIIRNYCPMDNL